jgi:hypothetical protein
MSLEKLRQAQGLEALQHEILGEQAATIGQLDRNLRDSLAALKSFDERMKHNLPLSEYRARKRVQLVNAAAYALWNFVVQRDCSGFRFTDKVLKGYDIPAEVRLKMGLAPSR